jgi:hypothetical protein
MTPAQLEAQKAMEAMKFRLEKSVKFINAEYQKLLQEDPDEADKFKEEKDQWRNVRRNELLALFRSHKEAKTMADAIHACYHAFLVHCPAADPFNLTDQEKESLPLETLITCLYAIGWKKLFNSLNITTTDAMAVYLATTQPHSPYSATLDLAWGKALLIDAAANAIGVTP